MTNAVRSVHAAFQVLCTYPRPMGRFHVLPCRSDIVRPSKNGEEVVYLILTSAWRRMLRAHSFSTHLHTSSLSLNASSNSIEHSPQSPHFPPPRASPRVFCRVVQLATRLSPLESPRPWQTSLFTGGGDRRTRNYGLV